MLFGLLKGVLFPSIIQLLHLSNDTAVWAAAQKTPDVWLVIVVCNDYLEINKLSDGNVVASSPSFFQKHLGGYTTTLPAIHLFSSREVCYGSEG